MTPPPRRPSRYGGAPGPAMAPDLTNWLLAAGSAVLAFGARVYRGGITRTGARIGLRQALGRRA